MSFLGSVGQMPTPIYKKAAIHHPPRIMHAKLLRDSVCTITGPKSLIAHVKIDLRPSYPDYGVFAPPSNLGAEVIEKIRNRYKQSTQSTQNGQRPMHS